MFNCRRRLSIIILFILDKLYNAGDFYIINIALYQDDYAWLQFLGVK